MASWDETGTGTVAPVGLPTVCVTEYLRVTRQRARMLYPSRRRTILDARLRRMWDALTAEERAYVNATWRDPR